ncbi:MULTISPECIES: PepSY domain-containing protein [unclassified Nitrosomonas]|jgi:uncharacterized membrane protein YkoI|uniref:PepSY domain-containing protein n=1 Tax=unclassified Nitrosomonas TaxID=2609265 RepID=UPI000B8312B4|nr:MULTISPECIES: PepSY domain-containing protein [unclassified Nitrosomonas]
MMTYRHCLLITVFIAGFISEVTAAQETFLHSQTSNQHAEISQQQAVTIARQHIPGRLLSVQHTANSYRVKILSSKGTVRIVTIDANSGAVIATH